MLNSRIPEGTRIGRTTSDGNCLFHVVSIALFGDESASHLLRLYATFHAMKHQRQILKGVSIIILCIGSKLIYRRVLYKLAMHVYTKYNYSMAW